MYDFWLFIRIMQGLSSRDAALICAFLAMKAGRRGGLKRTTWEDVAAELDRAGQVTGRGQSFTAAVVRKRVLELENARLVAIERSVEDRAGVRISLLFPIFRDDQNFPDGASCLDDQVGNLSGQYGNFQNENENGNGTEKENEMNFGGCESAPKEEKYIKNKKINNPCGRFASSEEVPVGESLGMGIGLNSRESGSSEESVSGSNAGSCRGALVDSKEVRSKTDAGTRSKSGSSGSTSCESAETGSVAGTVSEIDAGVEGGASALRGTDTVREAVDFNDPKVQGLRKEIARSMWEPEINPDLLDRAAAAVVLRLVSMAEMRRMMRESHELRRLFERTQGRVGKRRLWESFALSVKRVFETSGWRWTPTRFGKEPAPDRLKLRAIIASESRRTAETPAKPAPEPLSEEDLALIEGFGAEDLELSIEDFAKKVAKVRGLTASAARAQAVLIRAALRQVAA